MAGLDRLRRRCQISGASTGGFKKAIPEDIRSDIKAIHQQRDNWHGSLALCLDWVVIGMAMTAVLMTDFHPLVYFPAIVVIGGMQRALRSLMHEASHLKLTRQRALNIWLGRLLIAFPLFSGLSGYTCAHCEHHRHLWDDRLDPKVLGYLRLGLVQPRDTKKFVLKHLLRPLLLVHVPYQLAADLIGRDEERSERRLRIAVLTVAITALTAMGFGLPLLLLWVVPYCTVYQLLRYWSDIADHSGLLSDDPWQATRSWDAAWPVRQLLAPHQANLHLAHHLYPAVPHYRIEALHRVLQRVPQYQDAHHCDGFVRPRRLSPSVVQDVLRPERTSARAGYASCGQACALRQDEEKDSVH